MDDETARLLIGGGVTLTVAFVGFQLQQGGMRRRRRREIKEELELLEQLGDTRPVVRQRIEDRVDLLLERHAPAKSREGAFSWAFLTMEVLATVAALVAVGLTLTGDAAVDGSLLALGAASVAGGVALAFVGRLFAAANEDRKLHDSAGRVDGRSGVSGSAGVVSQDDEGRNP